MLGTKNVSNDLKKLARVNVVRPENALGSWKGTKHNELLMALGRTLALRGWSVCDVRYALYHDDAGCVLSCRLNAPTMANTIHCSRHSDDGSQVRWVMYPAFGFMASNTAKFRLTFFCGAMLANGKAGSYVCARWLGPKYNYDFDADRAMQEAIDVWEGHYVAMAKWANDSTSYLISELDVDQLLIQAAERELMPWSRLPRVLKHLGIQGVRRNRQMDKVQAHHLLFAFGQVCGMNPPPNRMPQQHGFYQMVAEHFNAR